MEFFLTIYLWILLLACLLVSGYLAATVTDSEYKVRLAVYFTVYNLVCILLRMAMPTREMALALNWMNPVLGLAAGVISPIDARIHAADPVLRVAIRATATLVASSGLWIAIGWVLGGLIDDRAR